MRDIEVHTHDDALVVAPVGDIDLSNADDLRAAILGALSNERTAVIVDLTATRYLDSAGIRVLFALARRLAERRRRLALVAPPDAQLRRLLAIVDIESSATLDTSVEAARARLRAS